MDRQIGAERPFFVPAIQVCARRHAFETAAQEVGFVGFGVGPRFGLMHVDLKAARQSGERFCTLPLAASVAQQVLRDGRF